MESLFTHGRRDPRVRDFVAPERILPFPGRPFPEGAERLLGRCSGQAVVHTPEAPCRLPAGSGILLDYGRELCGGIRIVSADNRPRTVRIRVRFGESISEALGAPNNDHAMHDLTVPVPWHGTADVGNTGFRFVSIQVLGEAERLEVRAVPALAVYRDLAYIGRFASSDSRLDRIWRTGAYTVHLAMQDYLWDGIKRDRLVWLGDMHPEVRVICSVFEDDGIVPASLDLARDNTPLPGYINGISSYSLWWIIIQWDWYLHQGDLEYLRSQREYLSALIDQLRGCVDPAGREQLPPLRFLDWPTSGDAPAIHAGLQGLLAWAFRAAESLFLALADPGKAAECRELYARLRRHAPEAGSNKQASAMKVLGGLESPAEINRTVLARDPLSGLSTFYGYYVLEARAAAGDIRGALEVIRAYWGGMLDFGATTFWEDFDLAWTRNASRIDEFPEPGRDDLHADFGAYCYKGLRHSLCHGWAGGPTAWLTRHVLGLRPEAPGCARVRIAPRLGDLDWAEGVLPTPRGPLRVRHTRNQDGTVRTEAEVPKGIEAVRPEDEGDA